MQIDRLFPALLLAVLPAAAGHRYEIDVVAQPAGDKLAGTARLTYRNDSGRTLEELPLRGIATIKRAFDAERRELAHTSSAVRLRAPLAAGREAVVTFEFECEFGKSGNGYRLVSGAWHPKAQTFRKGAFSSRQEQADDYDVRVTVPRGEIVAIAGKRVEDTALPDGSRRVRAVLNQATSFGIAMSPDFSGAVRNAAGVEIRSYRLKTGPEWGPKLADVAADIVPFYAGLAGFYPHPSLVILPGSQTSRGGYPAATGMVAIHDLEGTDSNFPSWIMAHEIGHQYWGFDTVVDDGDYYHWPGLAMGIWMDRKYMEARGLGRKRHDSFLTDDYLAALNAGRDTTLRRTWTEIEKVNFDFNNAVAHGKSYTVIQMLEETMGPARFREFAVKLLKDYRFRFLSHADFEKAAAAAHRAPLDWFFRDWLDTNRKLAYEIAEVKHERRRTTVRIRQTGDTALELPVLVNDADGSAHRLRLKRGPAEQTLSFNAPSQPVYAIIDPDRRFPLRSLDDGHVWGKKYLVADVRWPDALAWGTNQASILLRNTDNKPHEIDLHIQAKVGGRGVGWDTLHRLEPGEEKRVERDFILRPLPETYTVQLTVRDANGLLLKSARIEGEFKAGNDRLAPLRLPERLRDLLKPEPMEYPRLRLRAGTNVFLYYPENDAWLEQHAAELIAERERYFNEIRARINPAYQGKVTVLLFPDADSKRIWTGHKGMGWAIGRTLVEIRNAKESVDPAHELVHIISGSLGEPPAVLREGLAVYFQEGHRAYGYHVDAWCKAFDAAGMLWPLMRIGSLSEIGPEGTQPPITYPEAGSMVKFLIERVGFEKFLAGYRALGDPQTRNSMEASVAAFQKHFGMDPAAFEREWRAALTASSEPPVPDEEVRKVQQSLKSEK